MPVVLIVKGFLPKLLVIAMTAMLLAACGGSAATQAPEPTDTTVLEPTGFDRVVACMEDRWAPRLPGHW